MVRIVRQRHATRSAMLLCHALAFWPYIDDGRHPPEAIWHARLSGMDIVGGVWCPPLGAPPPR